MRPENKFSLASSNNHSRFNNDFIWEIHRRPPASDRRIPPKDITGVVVADVDGTLTVPGNKYKIDQRAVAAFAKFVVGGGRVVFSTGATLGRIERTVLTPLFHNIEELVGPGRGVELLPRLFVMPENGSAFLIFKRLVIVECEPRFEWHRLHTLHVPDKDQLRTWLEHEVVPRFPGSRVWSDYPQDEAPRDYIVSLTRLPEGLPKELVKEFQSKIDKGCSSESLMYGIDWANVHMKAARTTVDFVNADSGKTISVRWVLKQFDDFEGPVIGLGDLGDEFAKVIPTINVNKGKPNEFRSRGMPALDLVGGWEPLKQGEFVVADIPKEPVFDKKSGKELSLIHI